MTTEEKCFLAIAIFLALAIIAPFLMMAQELDAMKACMVEFSHDVCFQTLHP